MKFWKILSSLIEQTLPDWRDKFLSYKDLKKQLKLISPRDREAAAAAAACDDNQPSKRPRLIDASDPTATDSGAIHIAGEREGDAATGSASTAKEVGDFVRLLEVEIEKFNAFFVEKEEEYVIRWKELQDRVSGDDVKLQHEELMSVGREMVDLHGEMVLLENYSALNYTGLVKILKKYDKRSGILIRLPFIQEVLQQPFYSNETLCKLVKECEAVLNRLFSQKKGLSPRSSEMTTTTTPSSQDNSSTNGQDAKIPTEAARERLVSAPKELEEIKHMENMYMNLTLSALRVLKEIRSGSSTVSEFSLPPLQNTGGNRSVEELLAWKKKVPAFEQTTK